MGFFERLFGSASMALEFHLLRWWHEYAIALCLILAALIGCYELYLAPPAHFPVGKDVTITEGASLPLAAYELTEAHAIAHLYAFELLVRVLGGARSLHPGPYRFTERENALTIALRIMSGDSEIPPIRLTFPEGITTSDMADIIGMNLPLSPPGAFLPLAEPEEGYLFPDTYFFSPDATPIDIIKILHDTFNAKIQPLMPDVLASGHSLSDVIIMASILEAEAKTPQDMSIVSGILWKRLAMHMALQVDAAPMTYDHPGLPPGPIDNPGLDSIEAALHPTETSYLYYLTGNDGQMHYATTFAGHEANREKYLK